MAAMKKREKHLGLASCRPKRNPGSPSFRPSRATLFWASLLALLEMIKDMDRFGTPPKIPRGQAPS